MSLPFETNPLSWYTKMHKLISAKSFREFDVELGLCGLDPNSFNVERRLEIVTLYNKYQYNSTKLLKACNKHILNDKSHKYLRIAIFDYALKSGINELWELISWTDIKRMNSICITLYCTRMCISKQYELGSGIINSIPHYFIDCNMQKYIDKYMRYSKLDDKTKFFRRIFDEANSFKSTTIIKILIGEINSEPMKKFFIENLLDCSDLDFIKKMLYTKNIFHKIDRMNTSTYEFCKLLKKMKIVNEIKFDTHIVSNIMLNLVKQIEIYQIDQYGISYSYDVVEIILMIHFFIDNGSAIPLDLYILSKNYCRTDSISRDMYELSQRILNRWFDSFIWTTCIFPKDIWSYLFKLYIFDE